MGSEKQDGGVSIQSTRGILLIFNSSTTVKDLLAYIFAKSNALVFHKRVS